MRLLFSLFIALACLVLHPLIAVASALLALARSTMRPSGHLHLMPTTPRSILETRRMGLV